MLEVIKYPIDNCNIPTSVPYSNKMVLFTRKISKNLWIEENIQKKEEDKGFELLFRFLKKDYNELVGLREITSGGSESCFCSQCGTIHQGSTWSFDKDDNMILWFWSDIDRAIEVINESN